MSHKEINSVVFKQSYLDQNTFHFLISHGAKVGGGRAGEARICIHLKLHTGSEVYAIEWTLLKLILKMHVVSSHLFNNWLIIACFTSHSDILKPVSFVLYIFEVWLALGIVLTEFFKDLREFNLLLQMVIYQFSKSLIGIYEFSTSHLLCFPQTKQGSYNWEGKMVVSVLSWNLLNVFIPYFSVMQ